MRRQPRTAVAAALLALALAATAPLRADEPPAPTPAPEPKKLPTVDEVRQRYVDYQPAYLEYMKFLEKWSAEQRSYFALDTKAREAKQQSVQKPGDADLAKRAKELEDELAAREKLLKETMVPELEKRQKAFLDTILGFLKSLHDIDQASPGDLKAGVLRVKILSEQGGATPDIIDEAAKLHRALPDDRDVRIAFAQTNMALPPDGDPKNPRRFPGRGPRFERVVEALEPVVKAEPANAEAQLMLGVALCALGRLEEATKALDAVGDFTKVRPAVRILIGNPRDPDAAFRTWRECAAGILAKPELLEPRKQRCELLLGCRALRYAVDDLAAIALAAPQDREAAERLLKCVYTTNSWDQGVAAFRDLLAKNENDGWLLARYALVLFYCDRVAEARVELAKIPAGKLDPQLVTALEGVTAKTAEEWEKEKAARAEDDKRGDNPRVLLETDKGKVLLELFEDTAPNTVVNFVYLAGNGYFDGIRFHRVIPGFMAQGGDPDGTGGGGPRYCIKDELKGNTRLHWRGTVSMAKTPAPNSGGSQFFLCYVPTTHLNGAHTVFGRILEGQEVADAIEPGDAIVKATVLRKRAHDYKPEIIAVPGQTPWEPKKEEKPPEKKDEKPPEKQ